MDKPTQIVSVNKDILTDISIEELDERLKIEELETRGAAWTGCGCDCDKDICVIDW